MYQANYEPGWKGLGAITPMEMEAFKGWVKSDASKKPVGIPRIVGKAVTEFDDAALSRLATAPTLSEVARSKVAAEIERRTASADSSPEAVPQELNSWAPGAKLCAAGR
ncbi:MAG: hypothetical protein IPH39_18845 [Sulfuritalea sp.]|nr:hypothetical protein [Sulfuritalea sp.]